MKSLKEMETELNELKQNSNSKERELIDLVSGLCARIKEKHEAATKKAHDAADGFNQSVHDHPWHYIGSAALGGFLLGICLRRRKCR